MTQEKKPRIILWDLETSPFLAYGFTFYDYSLNGDMVKIEDSLICASWKVLGEKEVHAISIADDKKRYKKNPYDDYYVVSELRKVLVESDALIAHYGDKFDRKRFNDFLIRNKLEPLPPIITIDTHKIAKQHFHFKNNRLDYLGQFLGLGRKTKMSFDVWKRCMEGDEKAVKEMVDYNKQDVKLLEEIYLKISPFSPTTKLNMNLFSDVPVCSLCKSINYHFRGYGYTNTGKHRRFQCKDCGKWNRLTKNEPSEREMLK